MSRYSLFLLAGALAAPAVATAAVVELDGDALVGTYVQGISIGQVVTDKSFDSDDQKQRESTSDQRNAQGTPNPEVAISNADAIGGPAPQLRDLVPATLANIQDDEVRDLTEDALVQTKIVRQNIIGEGLDINYDKLAQHGVNITPLKELDAGSLRNNLLELMPSSMGYQFELMNPK